MIFLAQDELVLDTVRFSKLSQKSDRIYTTKLSLG